MRRSWNETSFSAWTYRRRENSIALGSKEPHQVAKNKFRTKFEKTSLSAWTYRYRENSIALGSIRPRQVAKNKFRTKFERTSLSAQSFWWRCVSGKHPFTFRTRWLRPRRPMVLYWWRYGRVGGCQIKIKKIDDEWLRAGRVLILADW